ncbi:hypothetical protein MXB_2844 [Myxobolus squamalis]|nr:hypothetical protein MXB_2844 [Myxobolus squamalis]
MTELFLLKAKALCIFLLLKDITYHPQ